MKNNVEAWQMGDEWGWEDGYYSKPISTNFLFPFNYTESEKQNFIKGYTEGYKNGKRDRENNS
jgi:hypothetical protein